jgi:DNA polymerase zeta
MATDEHCYDTGQRVVAHIHGVFPYLYVEYKGKLDADSVNAYIYRIGRSLNQVITDSYTINAKKKETPQYIAFITLCKGTPFYGYSIGYKQYLKIYLVDPRTKSRIGEYLRQGAVMNTKFEVSRAILDRSLLELTPSILGL